MKKVIITCGRGGGKSIDLIKLFEANGIYEANCIEDSAKELSYEIDEVAFNKTMEELGYRWEPNTGYAEYPIITPVDTYKEPKYLDEPTSKQPNDHINYLASLGGKKKKNKKVRNWD